jgi:hypothetical protein
VIEAKVGWQVPSREQLSRYLGRITSSNARHKRLVSVSAADQSWAERHLPVELNGVAVTHLSWTDIQRAAADALAISRSPIDKVWLSELTKHLDGYGMASNIFDARVYVVALNRDRIDSKNPLTWVDVVTEQARYFHPVGGDSRSGWPTIPPAYLGFRYHAEFRSAHFVKSVTTTDHLQDIDPRWPETNSPHFVYTLGPPMVPTRRMPLGKIHPSMRNWISIDLLLSGEAPDYKTAIDRMQERNRRPSV